MIANLGVLVEEQREAPQRLAAGVDRPERIARSQPEPGPLLDGLSEPELADHFEPGDAAPTPCRDAQHGGVPGVARIGSVDDVAAAGEHLGTDPKVMRCA